MRLSRYDRCTGSWNVKAILVNGEIILNFI
jgi:hypothetical protein